MVRRPPGSRIAELSSRSPCPGPACLEGWAIYIRSLRGQTVCQPVFPGSQDCGPPCQPSKIALCPSDSPRSAWSGNFVDARSSNWSVPLDRDQSAGTTLRRCGDRGVAEKIALENLAWDVWLAKNGLPFLSLTYEEILEAPRANLEKIAYLADTEIAFELTSVPNSGLEIQRDTVNAEWRERFLSQYSDPSKFPASNRRIRVFR